MKKIEPRAYGLRDAAKLLSVSYDWLYHKQADGVIPSIKMGGKIVILADTIDKILQEGIK